MQSEIDLLKQENARLIARIIKLERIAKEKDELKAEVAKLRYDFEILKQQTQGTTNIQDIHSINDISEQIVNMTANNTIVNTTTDTTADTNANTTNLNHWKTRKWMIFMIQYIRKQLNTIPNISRISTLSNKNVSIFEAEKLPLNRNKNLNIQDTNLSSSESKFAISSKIKIPYNQKVEQGLICELFEFIRNIDFVSLRDLNKTPPNCIYSKQILDIPVDIDLTPGSISHLAQLFNKVEKIGQKEKLHWYYYSEEYEKKVITISSENNISNQMARTQIYDEMISYLSGIKREYLHKMIQKAKNIYTLFKRIGIDKISIGKV
ncbi:hypothetical protein Glove_586g41 [Diversispora epigaea]|uniref:Uncharacterized protein n=1 Tax=Diversispora epigaea TaxID=1348612 RepID=A0A397GGV5_9GLOM|nr:hypothetical protein Glove_586g41 [Diversispora epigaea]